MIEVEIDGKKITVPDGSTIIEAADKAGIYIPRFCYHKKLSVVANCRMCLVEVEKSRKPLPACATPVMAEMKVMTRSPEALKSQRSVMEFLLINHPLDCPICDQGGECELQDLAMGYGKGVSRFCEGKRAVASDDLGSLIETEMTRCIHCTRCVRFGEEIAGLRELGATDRGENMHIGTYVKHFMRSEVSGNIIDLCPVGALTSKPFRYSARAWELQEHASIAAHDCLGSNVYVHTRGQEHSPERIVMRTLPRKNEAVNEIWLSDRDRFSYLGLQHEDRVKEPMVKINNQWQALDWQSALQEMLIRLQDLLKRHGAEKLGALASANASVEELYLLQKWLRSMGSNNIDHRLRQQDFSGQDQAPLMPKLGCTIAELEQQKAVLLIGSNLREEQPLAALRLRKAHLEQADIMAINTLDYSFPFELSEKMLVSSLNFSQALTQVAKALAEQSQQTLGNEVTGILSAVKISDAARGMAKKLTQKKSHIILGADVLNHPNASEIQRWANLIAKLSGAGCGVLTDSANASGAWLAGAVAHRGPAAGCVEKIGFNAQEMLAQSLPGYIVYGVEPELDCAYAQLALSALKAAELVICFSTFKNQAMLKYADFILPISPVTEMQGTLINIEGKKQTFSPASVPHGQSKPGWKVLRVIGKLMQLPGFEQETIAAVRDELEHQVAAMSDVKANDHMPGPLAVPTSALQRLNAWPMYRVDALVRRADALQTMIEEAQKSAAVNAKTADALQLQAGEKVVALQGDSQVELALMIDARVADGVVLLPAGLSETAGFGLGMGEITLRRSR